jgi:hypothetical protein
MVMLLAKSEKSKWMLSERDASLGAKDRQILIMCNGRRSYQELTELFGPDVQQTLDRFIKNGLLIDASKVLENDKGVLSQTGTFYASELAESKPKRSTHSGTAAAAKPSTSVANRTDPTAKLRDTAALANDPPIQLNKSGKRSIAASKMYMINLLQMHRDLDSSALAVNIHTSENEQQLVICILASLRYVNRKAGSEYGNRIAEQLSQILPENYLPDLDEVRKDLLIADTASAPAVG